MMNSADSTAEGLLPVATKHVQHSETEASVQTFTCHKILAEQQSLELEQHHKLLLCASAPMETAETG